MIACYHYSAASFIKLLATASMIARDASVRTTTSTGNTIATEYSHLMLNILMNNNE